MDDKRRRFIEEPSDGLDLDFTNYVKTEIINQIVNDPKNKQRNKKRTRDMSLDEFMNHTRKITRGE